MVMASASSPKPLERLMIFIDGGYLRKVFCDLFGDDNIDCEKLLTFLLQWYNKLPSNPFRANLIRAYLSMGEGDTAEYFLRCARVRILSYIS